MVQIAHHTQGTKVSKCALTLVHGTSVAAATGFPFDPAIVRDRPRRARVAVCVAQRRPGLHDSRYGRLRGSARDGTGRVGAHRAGCAIAEPRSARLGATAKPGGRCAGRARRRRVLRVVSPLPNAQEVGASPGGAQSPRRSGA